MNRAKFSELRSFKLQPLSLVTQTDIGQSLIDDETCHLAGKNDEKNSKDVLVTLTDFGKNKEDSEIISFLNDLVFSSIQESMDGG